MRRRKSGLPSLPMPGEYEFETGHLGPPVYAYPPPPVKSRGVHIPGERDTSAQPADGQTVESEPKTE